MNIKIIILRWTLIILCFSLAGCSLIKGNNQIEKQDIIGVWRENSPQCANYQSGRAKLEFKEDGHFSALNIPSEYLGYTVASSSSRFNASGIWDIDLATNPLENNKIRLRIEPVPEMNYPIYNDLLYVSGKKGQYSLFAWHGDPSNKITFSKVTSENQN